MHSFRLFCLGCFMLAVSIEALHAQAGEDRLKEVSDLSKKEGEGWLIGGGLGLDFAQLLLINPRVGAGENKIGFGGLGSVFLNYKKDKFYSETNGSIQLSVQRLGSKENPFQKNLDLIRVGSRAGYKAFSEKLAVAADFLFESQLTPTYEGNILSSDTSRLTAKFLSPARFNFSLGLDYKPDENLSVYYSPAALRLIYVADDSIAALNVHGNEENENTRLMLGSNLNVTYKNNFFNEKLTVSSSLDLFSNYLENPQNIDVRWINNVGLVIWKNISINVTTDLFYDDDTKVQTDLNDDGVYEADELARTVSFTQALLIKYNFIF